MNEIQSKKRNLSFILFVIAIPVFLGLLLVLPLLPPVIRPPKQFFQFLLFPAVVIPLFFWFKGFYHWSKGLGYSGILAIVGILGFPLALLVMVLLKDRNETAIIGETSNRECPNCGCHYRLNDYDPKAEHIFCSACKAELPKT